MSVCRAPSRLALLGTLTAQSACSGLLGLDDYRIEAPSEDGSGGASPSGIHDGTAGAGDTGGASPAGGSGGAQEDGTGGASGSPAGGSTASGGSDGGTDPACENDAPGAQQDAGCNAETPICDESGTPKCVECITDAHCSDGVSCTEDACVAGVCTHTADHTRCLTGPGTACRVCDPIQDCRPASSVVPTLLINETLGNGSFEIGTSENPLPWVYDGGEYDLVFDCGIGSTGCAGVHASTYTTTGARLLWLGGVDHYHEDWIRQQTTLPEGGKFLRIAANINFQTERSVANNFIEVWLLDVLGNPLIAEPLWRRTAQQAQNETADWTDDGLNIAVDVARFTETEHHHVLLKIQSTSGGTWITDFFLDHIRADVCSF